MRFERVLIGVVATACALSLSVVLAGCSSQPDQKATTAEPETVIALEIGEENGAAYTLELTNGTEAAIKAIAVKAVSSQVYESGSTMSGASWAQGDMAHLYLPAIAEPQQSASGNANTVAIRDQYDIQVTFEDGTISELHDVTPANLTEATLLKDKATSLLYLEYKTKENAVEDTLAAEKAIADQIAAEAAAAEQAALEAEQAAAEEAQNAAAAATTDSYSYSYDSSSTEAPSSAPSQSEDQCVEGGVVLR